MGRTRYLVAGVLAASIAGAAVTYVGRPTTEPRAVETPLAASTTLPGGGASALSQAPGRPQLAELERLIRSFGDQTTESPSAAGFTFLGQLELERARLTGDAASYTRAERALEHAVQLSPDDPEAAALLAGVRFTTHDFVGAFELASEVYASDRSLSALAVRGDAALELGRYVDASADYHVLAGSQPGTSTSLVRLSRLAFLRGDPAEAGRLAAAAERAAASEGAFGASLAWYTAYRGRLALDAGRYSEAARHYQRAVGAAPDYHVAVSGLASVRAAQGRAAAAIRLYERAVAMVPDPSSVAALGDVYALTGDERAAADRYATVEAIATLQAAERQLYDRQLAAFWTDHDGDLDAALAVARRSLETRRDIYGHDLLAWVLYRMGRFDEAREASERSLALGTTDARLWFHAGMISSALGEEDRARAELSRALALHPEFDPLLARVAAETLEDLGGPM